ncbi:hypothetical protein [Microseira wollei]|uniref:hypothetical protein n=1 Tax=Microseira wollei TaxID=467598 RepID=UPI001CFC695B|nr:hypothetical protein [Microseira wollei]
MLSAVSFRCCTGKPIHQSLAYFLAPVLSLSVNRVLDLIVEANETCDPKQNEPPDQLK